MIFDDGDIRKVKEQSAAKRERSATQSRLASALRDGAARDDAIEAVASVTAEIELAIKRSGNASVSLVPVIGCVGFFLRGEGLGLLISPLVVDGVGGIHVFNAETDEAFSTPEAALEFVMKELCQ